MFDDDDFNFTEQAGQNNIDHDVGDDELSFVDMSQKKPLVDKSKQATETSGKYEEDDDEISFVDIQKQKQNQLNNKFMGAMK